MGFNGTFLFVSADVRDRVSSAIEQFFADSGAALVARVPLACEAWRRDTALFGIAVAPPVSGWIAIADTEQRPNADLARWLADTLGTTVVISTIVEICDPPEPETITVFGAPAGDRFRNLYEVAGFGYKDLAHPLEQFHPSQPFDPGKVAFLVFRGMIARTHWDDHGATEYDDLLPF